jgi:hypothetical protein
MNGKVRSIGKRRILTVWFLVVILLGNSLIGLKPAQAAGFTYEKYNAIFDYKESENWSLCEGYVLGMNDEIANLMYTSYSFDPQTNKYSPAGTRLPNFTQTITVGYVVLEEGNILKKYETTGSYYGLFFWYSYIKRASENTLDYAKGTLIQAGINAPYGTYPINGRHTDGYWYVARNLTYTYDKYNLIYDYEESQEWTSIGDAWGYPPDLGSTFFDYYFNPKTNLYSTVGRKQSGPEFLSHKVGYAVHEGGTMLTKYETDGIIYSNLYSYWYGYTRRTSNNTKTHAVKTDLVQSGIVALDETYPDDGQHTDGFWYVKRDVYRTPPQIVAVVQPLNNQVFGKENSVVVPQVRIRDSDWDVLTVSYYIDNVFTETKQATNPATEQVISFSAFDTNTLSEGTHNLRFQVNDGTSMDEEAIVIKVDKTAPVLGAISFSASDNSIIITGSAIDAVSGLAAAPYRYTIDTTSSSWTANASHTFTNLAPNKAYSVKFEARDLGGLVSSKEQILYTQAQTPTASIRQASESVLELQILDNNPMSTSYMLQAGSQYVDANGLLTNSPTWFSLSGKQFFIKGLSANASYSLKLKARNNQGEETSFGPAVTGTTLSLPPHNITAQPSQRSVSVSWGAISGVSSYEIEVDGQSVLNTGLSASYTHGNLNPVTRHTYRVRALNAGGTGNWSNLVEIFTLPDPPAVPANLTAVPLQTEVALDWDIAVRAERYEVEADGTVINAGASPSLVHRGLAPKTEHRYRVRAVNTGGASDWSQPVTLRTLPYPPAAPDQLAAQPSIYSITFSWNKTEDAAAYEVEVDGLIIEAGDTDTYLHEGLEPVSGHAYRVRAKNAGGKSPWSAQVDMTTHPEKPTVPTNIMGTADEISASLTWYKVIYTDRYEIEVDGAVLTDVPDNQFVHEGLSPDSSHTYRIRAVNISGKSDWSAPVVMRTMPAGSGATMSLTNMVALVTNNRIMISWDTVAPNAKYDVEVDGVVVDNGASTIYNHTGLPENEFHTYKIRMQNMDGTGAGEWVAILSLSTLPNPPDAPEEIEAFAKDYSIELRWEKTNGATGYDIEIDGQTYDAGAARDYLHEGLASGTSHTYRVRAKNETGVTAWSAAIVKSTTSPDYLIQTTAGQTFEVSLLGWNVQDFSELSFVVAYDPDALAPVDLYSFTPAADLMASGAIPGSALTVEYTPGRIIYRMNQSIVPGTSWSGELGALIFKAKTSGETAVRITVE